MLANWPGLSEADLHTANTFFTDDIQAALDLGDPRLPEIDLEWVKKLLSNRAQPAAQLLPYLGIYRQAVQLELGKQGEPITAWLDDYLYQNQAAPF